MDTKLKNNKRWLKALVCMLLILCAAAGTMMVYPYIEDFVEAEKEKKENVMTAEEYNQGILEDFVNKAYVGSYGFYLDIQQKVQERSLEPFELFYPEYTWKTEEEDTYYQIENFNQRFESWNSMYQSSMLGAYGVKYQVVDKETGAYLTNASEDLSKLDPGAYGFYLRYSFDEKGSFLIEEFYNDQGLYAENLRNLTLNKSYVLDIIGWSDSSVLAMETPKNITVYLLAEDPSCYFMGLEPHTEDYSYMYYSSVRSVKEGGMIQVWLVMMILLGAAALILPCSRRLGIGQGIFGKLPFEISACLIMASLCALPLMADSAYTLFYHEGWSYLYEDIAEFMPYVIHFGRWSGFYAMWFVGILSLRQVFSMGPVRYIKQRVWCIAIWIWAWHMVKGAVKWVFRKVKSFFRLCIVTLDDIDLTDPSDRIIFKVLGLNFVIVFLCCVLWYFGVAALLLYTLILFFILKKYVRNIKEKYHILLGAARKLANGDLQAEITEDTGIFEPLTEELNKVQAGFSKAVEAEIRSQNMKTELITNVSHDLKTPLTAIITYVNLLKDENITEEERKNYINILDRKSLRLKQLIEDLFEISKAASGNIKVEKKMLNVTELVKQAAFEMEDRLAEAKIECRISVPEREIMMELDGEKTYRCLENLLINVSKYGMSGTRAYLTLSEKNNIVEIVVKNISAEELTMDVGELTERFIRGDKSRNTEGSGLGLAIVKSFVELQGGRFWIEADGDLFKAHMCFTRGEA